MTYGGCPALNAPAVPGGLGPVLVVAVRDRGELPVIPLYVPAIVAAFVVTLLELTEVVALVFALGTEGSTVRHGVLGAVAGTGVVGTTALLAGAVLIAFPEVDLLWASALLLAAFGVFLFRSTVKSYRRRRAAAGGATAGGSRAALQFAGGFTVGAVETTEAVVVLLALAAAGYGPSAGIGAVAGGLVLVVGALLVHERIRRIKTVWLKLGATSLVLSFALFWGGEAAGFRWPYGDLVLVGLFFVALVVVRGAVELVLRRRPSLPS